MSSKKKTLLTPNLRFPEFQGAEGWQQLPLGSIATFFKGKGLPKSALTPDGKTYCIHYGELFTEYQEVIDAVKSRTNLEENVFLSAKNDVLMPTSDVTPRGLAKACCLKSDDIILGGDVLVIRSDRQAVNGEFLARQIRHLERKVLQLVSGSTVFHLYASSMERLVLSFPDKHEQQKIADCLSSLDELITAQSRKVNALKTHKKGLMQQLFPREGETQPRLRFPEFRNAGEYEVRAISSFCKVGDIDHKMPSSVIDGIPYIMTGNFFGINGIDFDSAKKVSTKDYEQLVKKIKPEFGDIVIARYASVGAVRYIETKSKFLVSYSCAVVKCNVSEDSKYLYYILQSDVIQSKIGLEINASSQKNIGIDSIKKLNIFLPTLPEQQRIADCLTSFDSLITAETQELETLKTHKKGLMQQLFPSAETVEA